MYFVQKKNRCTHGKCFAFTCTYCCFATSSSMHTQTKTAKAVYSETINNPTECGSFKDNTTKRGSGGNSYAAYLAYRVGKIKCKKNSKCVNK